jgi:K+-transporting ATPase c subunit
MNRISRRSFLRTSAYTGGAALSLKLSSGLYRAFAQTTSGSATAWMQNNLSVLGSSTLRQICMPGTHDAGMSTVASGTLFSDNCNTQTQTSAILGQLQAGSRYFDIRPVISGGQYLTGHYSDIGSGSTNTWQGGNGQSIQSIISDINTFTASNGELIILNLSADLDTDLGNSSYAPFTQAQWNALFSLMQGINNLYIYSASGSVDLTTLTLDTYIGNGSAAVVVIVNPSASGISLGSYANQGFYPAASFPSYNVYSDTNDLNTMISDQISKMQTQRTSPDSVFFLLSWTLTQDSLQAAACPLTGGTSTSILDLANTADAQLSQILPACTAQCYPNVIYIDNIQSSLNVAALAMQINQL